MTACPKRTFGLIAVLAVSTLVAGCDELPDNPDVPDHLRVALVTSRAETDAGPRWFVYEIDEEGTVTEIVTSTEPIAAAHYTSFLGTRGSIGFLNADGDIVVRHLESGNTNTLDGPFQEPRFSFDGTIVTFSAPVADSTGIEHTQVFVLDRLSNEISQVTEDECTGESPASPCAFESMHPVFGEENELYMVRHLRTNEGSEQVSISAFTTSLLEQRYVVQSLGTRTLYPNSVFQGSLVVSYAEEEGSPDEVLGFYAINVSSGAWIDNQIQMRHASYCHDANILGVNGMELRVVTIPGEEVGRVPLPAAYGSEILGVECSFQPRDLFR